MVTSQTNVATFGSKKSSYLVDTDVVDSSYGVVVDFISSSPSDIVDPSLGVAPLCILRPSDMEDPSVGVTDGGLLSSRDSLVVVSVVERAVVIEDGR